MSGRPREDRLLLAPLARFAGWCMALYVKLVAATVRVSGPPVHQEQAVFAIWHESNLAAMVANMRLRARPRVVSFSTRGLRGIVMNTMLRTLGSDALTLPAEGERAEAAQLSRELARLGREGATVVVSPDGPLGPYRVAKPGALIVARESGLPVQPWAVAVRPSFRLTGRWDRHLVPLPFGRLRVDEGDQIRLAPRDRIKPRLAELQSELDRIAALADRRMRRQAR